MNLSLSRIMLFLVLPAAILLTGCALETTMNSASPIYTSVPTSTVPSANALKKANVFVAAFDKVQYEELDLTDNKFIKIDTNNQVVPFKTGKSFVKGIVLPDNLASATVRIEAIADKTVFVPTVLILKQNFRPSRVIDSSAFKYKPSGMLSPDRLETTFNINRTQGSKTAAEQYLLIFTTDTDMQSSTTLENKAAQYAKARSLADPRLPSPIARHAATGLIRVSVLDSEIIPLANSTNLSRYQDIEEESVLVEESVQETTSNATDTHTFKETVFTVPKPGVSAMFPETEELYHRLIWESVDAGDIDKAWRLVREGEKAGSATVRRTFMRALEKHQ